MNPIDLLQNLFIMAFADGESSSEELNLLAEHRDHWGMSKAQFDIIHYGGMLLTKSGVSLLFLFPFVAIKLVQRKRNTAVEA